MNQGLRHTYYVCLGQGQAPISWNPADSTDQVNIHTDYFGKVCAIMDRSLEGPALTFYLTWDLQSLPEYGDHVVAIVMGDEWCRVPAYSHRVRATFKCYGSELYLPTSPWRSPRYANWIGYFQHVNAWKQQRPGRQLREHAGKNTKLPPIYPIPLGYANQAELPLKPFELRDFDISFAGSVVHKPYGWFSPKRWFQTPKSYARKRMVEALKRIRETRKDWVVDLKLTPSYRAIRQADPVEYAERMMNARISLCPRGTSLETFRFFEALRAGCVVICEPLPPRWFYDDAPVIQINDWSELPATLDALLADPGKLEARHRAALNWWEERCSEEALGRYMAQQLTALQDAESVHSQAPILGEGKPVH